MSPDEQDNYASVSTHSRLKAAGWVGKETVHTLDGFNTQPPEGGWLVNHLQLHKSKLCFSTQPPEGGWMTIGMKRTER